MTLLILTMSMILCGLAVRDLVRGAQRLTATPDPCKWCVEDALRQILLGLIGMIVAWFFLRCLLVPAS